MENTGWYDARQSDEMGRKFFSSSPLHSGVFSGAAILCLVAISSCAWFLIANHSQLSRGVMILLLITAMFLGPIRSFQAAVMRHGRVRDLYFTDDRFETVVGDRANGALGVAARAILDDLFYSSLMSLMVVVVSSFLLRHGR